MRELSATADALSNYENALAAGDSATAQVVVRRLLAADADPVAVLIDVVAAAQRSVGARWQRGEWTVAQEHAATAISVAATKLVRDRLNRVPVTRGRVIVACAEREWHALPAMMIDCALRAHGWDTTLLGASTSPLRLSQYLQDIGPEAVAVSCSVLGALPAARRFIEAGTAAGVPVVVGGSAFGADDTRARALGATAWAPDAHRAVAVMDTLPAVVPPVTPLPRERATELAALEVAHRRLYSTLRQRWSFVAEVAAADDEQRQAVADVADDSLRQLLHAITAALMTDDARPVSETSAWIADVLAHRGVDRALVVELGGVLAETLCDYPLARAVAVEHFAAGLRQ